MSFGCFLREFFTSEVFEGECEVAVESGEGAQRDDIVGFSSDEIFADVIVDAEGFGVRAFSDERGADDGLARS